MLLIKTYLAGSSDKGLCLMAAENVKKGTVIHRDNFEFDREITDDQLKKLGKQGKAFNGFIKKFGTYNAKKKHWHLAIDNMRFMNHSAKPNTKWNGSRQWEYVALVDIKKGTELTCNYKQFEKHLGFKPK